MLHTNKRECHMQQHGSKYFTRRSPSRPWGRGLNVTFSEQGHVAYQIKWNRERSNIIATILPSYPLPARPWWVGTKGQNSTFSEYGHIAFQIKGNDTCSDMVANILPTDLASHPTTLGWGQKVKIQLFQNMVMLHIKSSGITNAATR